MKYQNSYTPYKLTMNASTILTAFCSSFVKSCDERIAFLQYEIDCLNIAKLVQEDSNIALVSNVDDKIELLTNGIKLIKLEKIIYAALGKRNNNLLFPKLLSKYDELLRVRIDMSSNSVRLGKLPENEYLEFCEEAKSQRDFIKTACEFGERR